MNTATFICVVFGIVFGLLAAVFAMLKDKAAILLNGFKSIPKEEREKYDKEKLSLDIRNLFVIWAVIFFAGAAASSFVNAYCAVIAFAVWLVLLFKNVHLDAEKAFKKYKK